MRRARFLGLIVLPVLLVLLAGFSGRESRRAWPAFVMLRKPSQTKTVLVRHSSMRDGDGLNDSIAVLTELVPATDSQIAHCDSIPFLEVAEFWGPQWTGWVDAAGLPAGQLKFDEASTHTRIWRDTVTNALIWENPGTRGPGYFALTERARGILKGVGLLPARAP